MKEITLYDKTIVVRKEERITVNYCENCKREFSIAEYKQAIEGDDYYHHVWYLKADYCPFCSFSQGLNFQYREERCKV